MAYSVDRLWHPTHLVNDLGACQKFFEDVFGLESLPVEVCLPPKEQAPDYPRDYSILSMIREVMFDCVSPHKYVHGGRRSFEDVEDPGHLFCMGFSVEGPEEMYQACLKNGVRCTDQANRLGGKKKAPTAMFSTAQLFFALPESAGLRYQMFPKSATSFPDPRVDPDWRLSPDPDSDPLGLEFCSHHTILTLDATKALNFLIGVLKGRIIHRGRNTILETDSVYIWLGDGIYEVATPTRAGSFAAEDVKWNAPYDTYHSLTWKVRDISKVEKHLKSENINFVLQDSSTIVTDPKDTIGVPWGFSDKRIPGDHRLAP